MTKTVWLAIALMLFVGFATIATIYARQGHEPDSAACRKTHEDMKNLSAEQRTAVHATVHAKIKAMKAEGATHAQIRAAVQEMLGEEHTPPHPHGDEECCHHDDDEHSHSRFHEEEHAQPHDKG